MDLGLGDKLGCHGSCAYSRTTEDQPPLKSIR
jgi:hypothetical protein